MLDGTMDLPAAAAQDRRRTEEAATILMVDDDASMRMLFERYLVAFGYSPLLAAEGEEALRIARVTPGIRLIILDLVMPGLSGQKLADQLAALLPEARLLVCSGHPENALARLGLQIKGAEFMQKPCRPPALQQRLSEMLAAR
jgi:CheY-like chemotaxis protein